MASTAELPRPGVEVVQEFQSAAPTIVTPTLVPFICGPAKEIVEVLNTDGTLNANAKQGTYSQLPLTVHQSAFPSPRGNIAQVNVEEASIEAFFQFGGSLMKLSRDPGESFLSSWNLATAASVESLVDPGGNFDLDGKVLVISVDNTARLNTSVDVTITFAGATPGAHLDESEVADQINAAVGADIASATSDHRTRITSLTFGAKSSITIRAGGTANTVLGFNVGNEYRVTGSGFRGQDQSNNTTLTPWIEWTRGEYVVNGTPTTFPAVTSGTVGFGLVDSSGTFTPSQASALNFISDLSLLAGDVFYADGVQPVSNAIIKKVEASRIKMGVLNARNSIFDANGAVVTAVYDDVNVNTLFSAAPFSPQFAWFKAENLTFSTVPQAAAVTGNIEGTAALPAVVEGGSSPAGPFDLTGLTLIVGVTANGVVADDVTFTFSGAPLADMPAVVAAIGSHVAGVAAVNDSGKLKLATTLTGATQELVLRKTSTAGATLGFTFGGNDLSGTGSDITFAPHGAVVKTSGNSGFANLSVHAQEVTSGNVFPMNINGLTIVLKISTDGGSTFPTTRTHTFSAADPYNDIGAVVTDISGDATFLSSDITVVAVGNELKLSTVAYGPDNVLKIDATSTSIGVSKLQYTSNQLANGGTTLVVKLSTDGGSTYPTTRTHQFTQASYASISDVLTDIQADATFLGGGTPDIVASSSGSELVLTTVATGDQRAIKVDSSSTSINGSGLLRFTPDQVGIGVDGLNGLKFEIKLNDRPHVYTVTFTSNSVVDAVTAINAVVGWPVAAIGGIDANELSITSDLKGIASKVEVLDNIDTSQANIALGFPGGAVDTGSGRPNPDFYVDISGNAVIGADILRSQVTGAPYDPGAADLYIQYTGLRLDVSPRMQGVPALISVSDTDTLTTVLGPLNQNNPLGLGMFFALINAPGILCTGMGVADAPASAPDGTLAAYAEVASFIEAHEVYAIAPLTHDETVVQMFKAHIELMESPEQKGERILFFNPLVPTRSNDVVAASGLNANSTLTTNQLVLDVNPTAVLVTNGINPALPIPVSANLYVEITVDGEDRKYNVSGVSGVVLTLNVTFASDENTDAFFTTTPLTESVISAAYSLEIRGGLLLLPGSTLPDKDAIAGTVQDKAHAYGYRRMFYTFPDKVTASVNGTQSVLEAYHACAAIAGMCAHFPPQQGFTNLPMVGFNGVQGSQDTYSNRQMNVMAAGGTYILVQDATGAPIISRMQLSTDVTSIEKRELSVTKVVDFTAKFLRAGLRNFIGTFNITQPFLDTVSTVIHGMLKFLEENGVLISGDLNNIIQSSDQPDTVLVDVTLDVPFPCNYIRLTLVI